MAAVRFEVDAQFDQPPRRVWDELTDWAGHGRWIPATRVTLGEQAPDTVGATFTAWTGWGRLALEDRMVVSRREWAEDTSSGACEVTKLGPVLAGRAGFTVGPAGTGAVLRWTEDVTVPWLPRFAAPVVTWLSAATFRHAMRRLSRLLAASG